MSQHQRADPDIDTTFRLLANTRRRTVLYHLRELGDRVVDLEDLVDMVHSAEDDPETGEAPSRDDVLVDIRHSHIPRLREAGVVDYDPRTESVQYRGSPTVEKWIEHAHRVEHD